jgi:hypothetical protein
MIIIFLPKLFIIGEQSLRCALCHRRSFPQRRSGTNVVFGRVCLAANNPASLRKVPLGKRKMLGSLGHSIICIDICCTIYHYHQIHHDDHGAQASTIQLSSMIYDAKAMVSSC